MRPIRPTSILVAALILASLVTTGCRVTSDDVQHWKRTVKGPGKILAVLMADKYPIELRTEAALALVEMEPRFEAREATPFQGLDELQKALQQLDQNTRTEVINGMLPGLQKLLSGAGPAPAAPTADATEANPLEIRAKDAAFLLIASSEPATREQLVAAVMTWYAKDFHARRNTGKYPADQVAAALGPAATGFLIGGLSTELQPESTAKLAELIAQYGTPADKTKCGERLVALELEFEGPAYLESLKKRVREQLAASQQPIDEGRVTAAATQTREIFINDGVLPALKSVADQPVATQRLLAIAGTRGADEQLVERRKRALMALEGKVGAPQLPQLLAMALDPSTPIAVRDYAFDRVGDIRSPQALPQMWPLVQSSSDQRLRWRAGELVLAIGGSQVASDFFARLPAPGADGYAPEELDGYASKFGQMTPQPTELVRGQLSSPNWWNRIIALHFFERRGTAAHLAAVERLTRDDAAVSGPKNAWEPGTTVGKVATGVLEAMKVRLAQPSGAGQAPEGAPR